jgi:hypothetical protein
MILTLLKIFRRNKMKKQLLIAAVAATMTSVAFADVSITGNAKFEWSNTDTGSLSVNKTNSEVNLGVKGKSGDTAVVLNLEFNTHGGVSTAGHMDVEDMYMTTKVGDISLKLGNYASGTGALLGEIDEGGRAHNKITASTTINGVKIYAGNGGTIAQATGASAMNNNMFAGVSAKVAGFTVQAKHNSSTVNSFGIKGDVAGFGVRLEQKNSDTASSDVTFGQITKSMNGLDLSYAWVDADSAGKIGESDSSIFAREANAATATGVTQISAKTSIAGNTVTLKSGTVEEGSTDNDFTQIDVKRKLASGATLAATYTDYDNVATTGTTEVFELDLSVKF